MYFSRAANPIIPNIAPSKNALIKPHIGFLFYLIAILRLMLIRSLICMVVNSFILARSIRKELW